MNARYAVLDVLAAFSIWLAFLSAINFLELP